MKISAHCCQEGTSDPHVVVALGDQTFKTRTVHTPPTVDNDPYAYGMARP